VLGTGGSGAFRAVNAAWVQSDGVQHVRNFAELRELVTHWDVTSRAVDVWLSAGRRIQAEARRQLEIMIELGGSRVSTVRAQQIADAKLRMQEESWGAS
jgi:hypothetical protein